jgi:hypothetical protein
MGGIEPEECGDRCINNCAQHGYQIQQCVSRCSH